jgi:hypothetical protein
MHLTQIGENLKNATGSALKSGAIHLERQVQMEANNVKDVERWLSYVLPDLMGHRLDVRLTKNGNYLAGVFPVE